MADLSHLDDAGAARMVDIGEKEPTRRQAVATGLIRMDPTTVVAIAKGNAPKGDVLGTARIAGIMASKRTAELIPLCHPLGLHAVTIDFDLQSDAISCTATASVRGRTGVEMEALTGVTVALLTLYDMAKAIDKGMVIDHIHLVAKTGGTSGDRPGESGR